MSIRGVACILLVFLIASGTARETKSDRSTAIRNKDNKGVDHYGVVDAVVRSRSDPS